MAGENLITLSDDNFEAEVVNADKPTLVDFWAAWCAPCRAIAPAVEELANDYHGRIRVGKLNVDDHPKTATQYGIKSIPSLLLFKDGKVLDQVVGAVPKEKLESVIKQAL